MIHNTLVSLVTGLLLITMIGCGSSSDSGDTTSTPDTTDETNTSTPTSSSSDSSSYVLTDLGNGIFKIDFIIDSTTNAISYSFTKEDVTSDNYVDVMTTAANDGYSYSTNETTTLTCTKVNDVSFTCIDLVDADEITLIPGDGIYLFKTTAISETDLTFENQLELITMQSASDDVVDIATDDTDDSIDDVVTIIENVDNTTNIAEVAYIVKKTGQTKSFDDDGIEVIDSSLKDDGYYQTGLEARYTRASDIVTDELTGLMWQDEAWTLTTEDEDAGIYTQDRNWTQALDMCENLTLGGYTNWKLPSKKELQNIIDYSVNDDAISIEFENRQPLYASKDYWTSSMYVSDINQSWIVNFSVGSSSGSLLADKHYVRCARNQE